MLLDYNRIAACVCPFCSTVSHSSVSVFNFSGNDSVTLRCPTEGCGEKCVTIAPRGKKYRIDVECPFCSEVHSFYVPEDRLWRKDILTFKCPKAGIDIFFIGKQELVEDKVNENIKIYEELIEEYEGNGEINVLYEILERLSIMSKEHGLRCRCGCEHIEIAVADDGIILTCGSCGYSKKMRADEDMLMYLLNTDVIIIK